MNAAHSRKAAQRGSSARRTAVHPPKPRFALSVGVIGHRPNRLPEAARTRIAREIDEALEAIRAEALSSHARHAAQFSRATPRLVLVTALAEGADRMTAEAALAKGFELETPLPFPTEEYEKDFEDARARALFRDYLNGAHSVLELEGDRAEAGKSYAAAGLVVLDNSDILIAVWDGGAAQGRGGTTELIHEAGRRGMPVVRVDVTGEKPPRLHWRGLGESHLTPMHIDDHPAAALDQALADAVDAQIRPPRSRNERQGLERYLSERWRRMTVRIEYPLLMVLMGIRWPRSSDILLPDPEPQPGESEQRESVLAAAFRWADAIAVRFGQDFRSAVVTNFLVAAIAVIMGAFSFAFPWSAIELVLVLFLVVNAFVGHKRRWHHRWIESREVAERLRVAETMRALATRPLGPFGAVTAWPAWYTRALAREAGLRSGRLDAEGLAAARRDLEELVSSQASYHSSTARRFQRLHDRLTLAGQVFFVAALALSAAMFIVNGFHLFHVTGPWSRLMIVVSASLPALASASYGIRVIGDFEGAAKRSARMCEQLRIVGESIQNGGVELEWLRDRVHMSADVMLGDVANWRLLVESRELGMPG